MSHRFPRRVQAALQVVLSTTVIAVLAGPSPGAQPSQGPVLQADSFRHYIEQFNRDDEELYVQHVPNARAWEFLRDRIPLFECPDKDIERTYYFRWWTYRKHIKQTPDGFVITEFLPPVGWAGKHNTISCAAGHHFYEGRWLRDPAYLDDYAVFWFRKGGEVLTYSFWAADALWARYMVTGDKGLVLELLPDLIANYEQWEKERLEPDGLFWQIDGCDGMEVSIGGSGKRATINSYMYADAVAIAKIASLAGQPEVAKRFRQKAERIKTLVQAKLWDAQAGFFKTLLRDKDSLVDVRELHGYSPWYANLPDNGHEQAWKQIMAPQGFYSTSDGGRFLWERKAPNNGCVQVNVWAEPRVMLLTPYLAARLTDVKYTTIGKERAWDASDASYFVNGGRTAGDTTDPSYYSPTA